MQGVVQGFAGCGHYGKRVVACGISHSLGDNGRYLVEREIGHGERHEHYGCDSSGAMMQLAFLPRIFLV
jgi:hypothetical protein